MRAAPGGNRTSSSGAPCPSRQATTASWRAPPHTGAIPHVLVVHALVGLDDVHARRDAVSVDRPPVAFAGDHGAEVRGREHAGHGRRAPHEVEGGVGRGDGSVLGNGDGGGVGDVGPGVGVLLGPVGRALGTAVGLGSGNEVGIGCG